MNKNLILLALSCFFLTTVYGLEPEDKQKKNYYEAFAINDNVQFLTLVESYRDDLDEMISLSGFTPFFLRSIVATNQTIRTLFEVAYGFPSKTRTVIQVGDTAKFQSKKYCFVQIVPEAEDLKRMQIMQQQLEQVFPYKAHVFEEMASVKVLRVIGGRKSNLTANMDSSGMSGTAISGERFQLIHAKIDDLAQFAETRFKQPVLNETGLTGRYDLTIESSEDENGKLEEELRKLGLELVDAQRKIKILFISGN
jgi:uncharacterized protein (TIGR03435 family)